jgi:hypothetical protein
MENEEWRDVVGYEGLYEVSNYGNIRNYKTKIKKLFVFDKKGYVRVSLYKNSKPTMKRVHRFVALAFISNPLKKSQVNHIDGDKDNNIVSNLEWVTNQENMTHAIKSGLFDNVRNNNKGSKNNSAKLTENDVFEIRKSDLNYSVLAKKYNVDRSNIYLIVKRKKWNHI